MLLAKSRRTILSIGLVLFVIGCIQTTALGTPTLTPSPVFFTPIPPSTTAEIPPTQNTTAPAAIVKAVIKQPAVNDRGEVFEYDLAFSPDDKTLISESLAEDGLMIELWDISTGQSIDRFKDSNRLFSGMSLSPDGKMLAYGRCGDYDTNTSFCRKYEIVLWDMVTHQPSGQPISFPYKGPKTHIELTWSPDSKILAQMFSGTTGSGIVQLFDVTTRQLIATPLGGEEQFTSLAFSPDGKSMALGSVAGIIYIWDVDMKRVLTEFAGERGFVMSLAFSPDGKNLASRILIPSTMDPSEKIVLWDLATLQPIGQPLTIEPTHSVEIYSSTVFSPDIRTLAFINTNEAIALWDLSTSQPIGQPFMGQSAAGTDGNTTSIAFSPDGKMLASEAKDGTISLWEITTSSTSP